MRLRAALVVATFAETLTGCKADRQGEFETNTIAFAKHHILIGNGKQNNSLPPDAQSWADVEEASTHYCVACHAMDGQNAGVSITDHISPPVASLASDEVQRYTDGQLKAILDCGIWLSGMHGAKGTLSADELRSVVIFMRRRPPARSLGTPEMYTH